ncbi:MAG: TIGR03792 family protein [Vulcanococcus sp.]|uniref:TIGR03792 family protein n=1 Tax=Vulcanococcus sp. TaxID=2856995 RepID=UPI0025E891A5|nr:TIGR03792 family protein [Vulcanococcus sp.]MBW0174045.1 TIGR03792 family protein [Vulcanococcus sp.]MBW0179842.1 TIGR03792 family protein [Vulcanococcus sp.]
MSRRTLARVLAHALFLLMLLAGHPDVAIAEQQQPGGSFEVAVVEHLRVKVPAEARQAWLEAERGSWEPWLAEQEGYLGRDLLWDAEREEGTLLIRWASREQWKAIPLAEVEAVQERFEQLARQATGTRQGNPFPLVFEGELQPAA